MLVDLDGVVDEEIEDREVAHPERLRQVLGHLPYKNKTLVKCFSKVTLPTRPSTSCLLFLVIKLSGRVCGAVDLTKTI